jgi:hypothetical protein
MIEIKVNDPQPLPCPKCNAKEGYQYSDYISVHYTSHHSVDGKYEGGSYSSLCKMHNRAKSAYCLNCGTKLPFKLKRQDYEDVS